MRMRQIRPVRGFTLLEVLIALLIFSFGMLGLAALQAYSIKTNQSAHLRSQATALAYMMLDSIRANRTNLASYYSNSYAQVACGSAPAASPVAVHDIEFWRQQINCELPNGAGAIAQIAGTNEVAVCIRWSDARWESDSGDVTGSCADDAVAFGATLADAGSGAGMDGQVSVFVVSSRF